jgi:hypothetical protein
MRGAIPPLPQYALMEWYSVKARGLYLCFAFAFTCKYTINKIEILKNRPTEMPTYKKKLSLCLIKHHAMNTFGESRGVAPLILNLGTRWR